MDKNIEKEYKILVSKDVFYSLLELQTPLSFTTQVNIYYDTSEGTLRERRFAMRIRTISNQHTFTLKVPCDAGVEEFECLVSSNDIEALQTPDILALLEGYGISGPFTSIASLSTRRAIVFSEYAQLCFDISEYNDTIDYEIEYEYIKEHDGRTAFNQILREVGCEYTCNAPSKIVRALQKQNTLSIK